MRLVETLDVDFSAHSMHFDSQGILWSLLGNGMLTRFDRLNGSSNEPFGNDRFRAAFWDKDMAYLLRPTSLHSLNLLTGQYELVIRCDVKNADGPLCVDLSTNSFFFVYGPSVVHHSMQSGLIREFNVGFLAYSFLRFPDNKLWIGGDGLEIIDTSRLERKVLDSDREMPILQMAYDPTRDIIACAGGVLQLHRRDGQAFAGWGSSHFRCQFTRTGSLVTRTLNGKHLRPPKISFDQISGIAIIEISDSRAFLYCETDDKETLVVSDDGQLCYYDASR